MKNVYQRLLIFFLGIPIVLGLIFINFYNHLVINIIIMIFSALGANEFYNMLIPRYKLFNRPLIIILTVLQPFCSYIFILLGINSIVCSWILIFEILVLMGVECFSVKDFTDSVSKISLSTLIVIYCGFMFSFIVKITGIEDYSTHYMCLYVLFVFMCDSIAWFFGVLFGKNSRGIVAASPNKSVAGFIGGFAGAIVSAILMKIIFKDVFPGAYWKIILIAVCCAASTIIGDLIESVFKRSCNVKDSGKLIPGRGGILDSLDSLLATAPVFYTLAHFLYHI
jgi:phosphatidate cytidylyltransferase